MYSILPLLSPARALSALKRRGVRGAGIHLLRRLGTRRGQAYVGPVKIRINPMNAICNHTCPMCWLQHETPEGLRAARQADRDSGLSLADYIRIFDSMPSGLQEVELVGGGEPLLHPEIAGICGAIKQRGWRGMIYTNGTLLTEVLSRSLVEIGWDTLRISMHAGSREPYRQVQGVDRFDHLVANLKTYIRLRREMGRERQCRLILFHVIQRENLHDIPALFQIGQELGADEIHFYELIAYNDCMRLTTGEIRSAIRDLESGSARCDVTNNAHDLVNRYRQGLESTPVSDQAFRPARRCSVGFDQAFISATGAVKPCCFSDEILGDTRAAAFDKIWHGDKYAEFRKRLIEGNFANYCISQKCSISEVLHNE